MHFIVVVSKGFEFFFWVGVCMNVMNVSRVGNVVQSVQCDKGLVFFLWNQIRKAKIAQERRLRMI